MYDLDDVTPHTDLERSSSPANSRDGSITPTPDEDVDTDEPLTPKKLPEGQYYKLEYCSIYFIHVHVHVVPCKTVVRVVFTAFLYRVHKYLYRGKLQRCDL